MLSPGKLSSHGDQGEKGGWGISESLKWWVCCGHLSISKFCLTEKLHEAAKWEGYDTRRTCAKCCREQVARVRSDQVGKDLSGRMDLLGRLFLALQNNS